MNKRFDYYNDRLNREPVIIMFSTGKDSIVCIDLFFKYYKGPKETVFLYFAPGLYLKESIIKYYEKHYSIKIHQLPSQFTQSMILKKKVKLADIENGLRRKFNISYIVQGTRQDESLVRLGMLSKLKHGFDERNKKIYPIFDWSQRQVFSYIKLNKLKLPIEYELGYNRDIWSPDAKQLLFLKHNFPGDYTKIIEVFPNLETETIKEELYQA